MASLVFPDGPGTSAIARLMRVNFFAKTKTNIDNLQLSRWKTIEIDSKIVRFQRLNFSSKPMGCLLQTTKLWEKLIVLNRRKEKSDEQGTKLKEEVNFLSLKRAKLVKMTNILFPLIILLLSFLFCSCVQGKMEFKLLSISSV